MKGFINIPYKQSTDIELTIKDLREKLIMEIEQSCGKKQIELTEVLKYLSLDKLHHSEGRNFSFNKESFSVSEIEKTKNMPDSMQIKYLLYRYRFNHYPRHGIVPDFPIVLCVEPASYCNLRCIMCFQSDKSFTNDKFQRGVMDLGLYKKIIDEAAYNDLCSIVLASRGEPTLNKNLPEMISYARSKGILDIKVNTNATTLNPELSISLLKAFGEEGINTLVFSVDSAEKEEFEDVRKNADFDQIVENIRTFNKIRQNEFPRSALRTRVSMVIINKFQQVEKATNFWSSMVDEFASHHANDRLYIYNNPSYNKTRWCSQLFERLYIWFDGTVNTCDEDYKSVLSPGNIRNSSIKEIWSNKKMQRYRELHKKAEEIDLFPCDRCYRVNG